MSSIRSSMPASPAPSAASTAAAWMTVPRCRSTSEVPAPAAASSSQRSPHLVKDSTCDGDSWMIPPLSGPGSDSVVSAYHCRGCAPRTPAAASRASWAAAAARTARGRPGSAAAWRSSAVSAGSESQCRPADATGSISTSSPASSARNRDGRSSLSSPPAAVTTRACRARVTAT